ncbi:hypothetical protein BIV57_02605 [Mangrovactinospora gilvigrisea]|uniref:RNA polymerase subunit sigma-24 n=1 Tax=Mangrovactinospora gilvigrisea TaxID=1428644 RepID=A0A1J7BK89_9ACTN|nr:RNA polymerase sigma factor [Mangrovactinospora gilvigrisea]OIV39054.1 hypothetical protein BIV57_02605 [Mangrovactinospora gilvigrisea]
MEGTDIAVRRARDGDEEAFSQLYRELTPGLLRYARVMVGGDSPAGAEDVVSEAWAQLARALPDFEGGAGEFRRFAIVVVRNRALDVLRRHRRVRAGEVPVPDEQLRELASASSSPGAVGRTTGEAADVADLVLEALSTERAVGLIAGLPRDQAEAVMLRVVLGLDATSAGQVLGKRPGAVRMAVSRGLRSLEYRVGRATACAGESARGARKR